MYGKLIQPEIEELVLARDFATIREVLKEWNPIDLADLIDDLADTDLIIVLRLLPKELLAETFSYFDPDRQTDLIKAMAREEVASILNEMSPDDRTRLFEEMPPNLVKELIATLSFEERIVARALLNYPEDSVGRLMTPDYISVSRNWTVEKVLDYIRRFGKNSETLNFLYIIDEDGKLVDDLHIRELLLAQPETMMHDLMDEQFIALSVYDSEEEAVSIFRKYDRTALPVVDSQLHLLGIVTIDDMMDVADEIATEDIQKFGGMEALEEPYATAPLLHMVRKRASWLVILFLGEMLSATAMGFFEAEISKAVILALFLPLIISSGGNSGSQAATLTIRSLALEEITLTDWLWVMRREIISGFLLGVILGAIGFLRIAVFSMFSGMYGAHPLLIATVVGVSLIGIVLWGTLCGSMLPFVMKKLGFDPAASSAPFVATLVDVTGIIIYFTAATLILKGTLL